MGRLDGRKCSQVFRCNRIDDVLGRKPATHPPMVVESSDALISSVNDLEKQVEDGVVTNAGPGHSSWDKDSSTARSETLATTDSEKPTAHGKGLKRKRATEPGMMQFLTIPSVPSGSQPLSKQLPCGFYPTYNAFTHSQDASPK